MCRQILDKELQRIKFLEDFTDKQDELIKNLNQSLKEVQKQLAESRRLSTMDKSYPRRVIAALRGLTTDYYHYKLHR